MIRGERTHAELAWNCDKAHHESSEMETHHESSEMEQAMNGEMS